MPGEGGSHGIGDIAHEDETAAILYPAERQRQTHTGGAVEHAEPGWRSWSVNCRRPERNRPEFRGCHLGKRDIGLQLGPTVWARRFREVAITDDHTGLGSTCDRGDRTDLDKPSSAHRTGRLCQADGKIAIDRHEGSLGVARIFLMHYVGATSAVHDRAATLKETHGLGAEMSRHAHFRGARDTAIRPHDRADAPAPSSQIGNDCTTQKARASRHGDGLIVSF